MTSSSTEFYEWLIRVTALIRAQKEPREQELFEIFVKELGQVFQFDHLAMKKQLIHNLPLILLAAAPALAEQPIKAEIPFSFHLGGSVLPAAHIPWTAVSPMRRCDSDRPTVSRP